jgi:hypothetical protein
MGRLLALTARTINGQTPTKPRVIYVNEDHIKTKTRSKSSLGPGTRVIEKVENESNDYIVYEKGMHIEAVRDPATTDVAKKQHIELAQAGVGSIQAGAKALTKYYNEALTLGAGATDAFVLPAATKGKVLIVINNDASGDPAEIFPAVGEFINSQAVNTSLNVASGDRIHFVCPETAGKWVTAEDFGK